MFTLQGFQLSKDVCQIKEVREKSGKSRKNLGKIWEKSGKWVVLEKYQGKSRGNLANARDIEEIVRENVCFCFFNRSPNMLKELAIKHFMPLMKLLLFIFHDGNRAHFAQINEGC